MIILKNILASSTEKLHLISIMKKFLKSRKNSAAILVYHDIGKSCDYIKRLNEEVFYKQINWLKQNVKHVPLNEIVDDLKEKKSLESKVAFTFDDGFKSFFSKVHPLLKSFQIPATVFVTIDFLNGEIPWYYKIRCVLCKTENKMSTYKLNGEYLKIDWQNHCSVERAYKKVKRYFGSKTSDERNRLIDIFAKDFQVSKFDYLENKMMNWDQIKILRDENIDIGCHSFSHSFLLNIKSNQLKLEVNFAKKLLQENLNYPINHFCYPVGKKEDFDSDAILSVKNAGFKSACTSEMGYVKRGDNPFKLRRIYTSEPYLAKFALRMP